MSNSLITIEQFKSYFKGKTVAVVANSSKLLDYEYGSFIDSHDIVIRFNVFKIIPKHTGSKTSVHASVFLSKGLYDVECDMRIIYAYDRMVWNKGRLNIIPDNQNGVLNYVDTDALNLFAGYPKNPMTPTTGFYVLSLLERFCDCKKINAFGFTFYKDGEKDILRLNQDDTSIYDKHAYDYERSWMYDRYIHQKGGAGVLRQHIKPSSEKIKYSIVMAYYNRVNLLLNTLRTIARSKQISRTEVIIVDDGSDKAHRIEHIVDLFDFPITVIRVEPEDKWYHNPSIPYNFGIRKAVGEVIILQNPEVLHTGDILSDISVRFNAQDYLVYGTYCITENFTRQISALDWESDTLFAEIRKIIEPTNNRAAFAADDCGWYNHSIFRPSALHFLSVISKSNMDKLRGFDERYALGVDYDDNELLHRIKRNGINVKIVDTPFAIHQNHPKMSYNKPNVAELRQHNKDLFEKVTKNETKWGTFNVDGIKVSVVMPFYNRVEWTLESVDSILNQTHKNIEIILVNDQSTEDISEVLNLAKIHKNIQIYNTQENYGAGIARNVGMSHATGSYIAFLDSDDKFLPSKIEQQLKFMINEDYDASHTSYYTSNNGEIKYVHSGKSNVVFPDIISYSNIATPSFMVKRKFVTDHNLAFQPYRICEDVCFFIQVCQHTNIAGLPIPLLNVRSHTDRSFTLPKVSLIGLSNILHFVTSDPVLLAERGSIVGLCQGIKVTALQYASKSEQESQDGINMINGLKAQIEALTAERVSAEQQLQQTIREVSRIATQKVNEAARVMPKPSEFPSEELPTTINPKHPKVRFDRKPI